MPKLTETFARTAPTKNHWDTEIGGFALFVGKLKKSWFFQKDVNGKTVRTRLGTWPTLSAFDARRMAMKLATAHMHDVTPEPTIDVPTLRQAMDTYLSRPKPRSEKHKANVRSGITRHLGDWLDKPLDTITKAMCVARHMALAYDPADVPRPSRANNALQHLQSIYKHACRVHDLPNPPTFAIEWFDETPPRTIITDLPAWLVQVDAIANPIHRAYYKLLMLTGLRATECASLTWDQVRADHIHLPMTKNGRAFDLPILAEHHVILDAMHGLDAVHVFPAWKGDARFIQQPERMTIDGRRVTKQMHRRTFATLGANAGLFIGQVGALLNHTETTVTGARYVATDYKRLTSSMEDVIDAFRNAVPALFEV